VVFEFSAKDVEQDRDRRLVQDSPEPLRVKIALAMGIIEREVMVFCFGDGGDGPHGPKLDDRAHVKRAMWHQEFRPQTVTPECGAHMAMLMVCDTGNATEASRHPRDVGNQDPHKLGQILQVANGDVSPCGLQVLGSQAPVAPVWQVLAAKQDDPGFERAALENGGHVSFVEESDVLPLVFRPREHSPAVGLEHVIPWSEDRKRDVLHATDVVQEVRQVAFLRETGELRGVVEADITKAANAARLYPTEE